MLVLKKFFCYIWKFLSHLVCVPVFKSIAVLYSEKSMVPHHLGQRLGEQNTSVGIGLNEFAELFDTLNCKPFFKHYILQTILHVFLLCIFVWNKTFCSKNRAFFYILFIWFYRCYSMKVSMFLVLFV